MACEPNQLLEDAKCIMWCVDRGANLAIKLSLLCAIVNGGIQSEALAPEDEEE